MTPVVSGTASAHGNVTPRVTPCEVACPDPLCRHDMLHAFRTVPGPILPSLIGAKQRITR